MIALLEGIVTFGIAAFCAAVGLFIVAYVLASVWRAVEYLIRWVKYLPPLRRNAP